MDRAINGGRQFIDAHQQFTGAMGHHAMNPLHGAAQAVSHGVQSLTDRLPQGNPVRQIVGETVASDDAALRQREADYQARVPDSMASYAGAAAGEVVPFAVGARSEEHTSELQSLMRNSYAVFCLKKKNKQKKKRIYQKKEKIIKRIKNNRIMII